MDDLYNHRKRKADGDDCNVPPQQVPVPVAQDALITDPSSSSSSCNAPRQPWLTTTTTSSDDVLWRHAPASRTGGTTPKRPRLDIPGRKNSRRSPTKRSPTRSPVLRSGSDLEDIGILPTSEPGPSRGSLLQRPARSLPFDLNPLPSPPHLPLINRQTLKELDLDAILRNPQLRHDLLFDPGLQFRPTSSKRKRDLSERYWAAVLQEIENGCTCISFDSRGKLHQPVLCVCSQMDDTSSTPSLHQVRSNVYTSRTPSRIRPLLCEFLEVLLLVIQPLCTISGVYVNSGSFKSQMQEHSDQASFIRSLFDPTLIEQELKHNVFNPSGLFSAIGATLKGHCAPMRDSSVEAMVEAAQACGTESSPSTSKDGIKAIRMCMEILELMKLDIANHQLQTLRPFLIRTSAQFELRTLKSRHGHDTPLSATHEWIQAAHNVMMQKTIRHPHLPAQSLRYSTMTVNQKIYLSVVRGLVDLVFNPPLTTSSSLTTPSNTPPNSPTAPSVSAPLPAFPETLYLDNNRMLLLSSDAADATALNMLLLLYRQLVLSENSSSGSSTPPHKLSDADILKMKREIRDISGTFRLGTCFARNQKSGNKDGDKWLNMKEDLVLQIARRVKEGRGAVPSSGIGALSSSLPQTSPCSTSVLGNASSSTPPTVAPTPSTVPSFPICESNLPNPRTVSLGQNWVDSHMQAESALSAMLHNRLRDVVFDAVLVSTYPGRDLTNGFRPPASLDLSINAANSGVGEGSAPKLSGLEPLSDEIRTLVEKISLLVLIHLNTFLPLYEKEGLGHSSIS